MTAYAEAKILHKTLQWSGVDRKKAIIFGAIGAFMVQNSIEVYDGFSAEWGASPSDVLANGIGASIYATQELLLGKQLIKLKYGLTFNDYEDPILSSRSQYLYGSGMAQRFIKDYNGTSLWLCTTPKVLFPKCPIPKWLGVAVGFGNGGMFGGYENQWVDKQGTYYNRSDVVRYRKFLLSPDIDFEQIETKNKFWNSMLMMLNFFKIPMPTMEINTKGELLFHPLYLVQFNKSL
jgi:hypothetical protein